VDDDGKHDHQRRRAPHRRGFLGLMQPFTTRVIDFPISTTPRVDVIWNDFDRYGWVTNRNKF